MSKSMTGYGRFEAVLHGRSMVVEVRSVNNRYLDCTVKLPRAYLFAEDAMKKQVQKAASRGKVDVFVTVDSSGREEACRVTWNRPLAEGYAAALRELAENCGLTDDTTASMVARFPDVLQVEKEADDLEEVTADLCAVLKQALDDFNTMRSREGIQLDQDILGRLNTLEELCGRVEERSPQTVAEYRARLEARMREVLESAQIEESRILTEAALFADKVAVDEETVRLRSHLAQMREMLRSGAPVGRKLDFLVQEMNRETNTIGSKGNDLEIARWVVDMKAELEKIREQVQNIE